MSNPNKNRNSAVIAKSRLHYALSNDSIEAMDGNDHKTSVKDLMIDVDLAIREYFSNHLFGTVITTSNQSDIAEDYKSDSTETMYVSINVRENFGYREIAKYKITITDNV